MNVADILYTILINTQLNNNHILRVESLTVSRIFNVFFLKYKYSIRDSYLTSTVISNKTVVLFQL